MMDTQKGKSLFLNNAEKFQALKNKFKDKNFVQNALIEIVVDLLILCAGIIVGYYIKSFFI